VSLCRIEQQRFASSDSDDRRVRHTTVLCVRKDNKVVVMADGQVTQGSQIIKPNVKKVRRITEGVIGGFAGVVCSGVKVLFAFKSGMYFCQYLPKIC
jgi:ATP-dependent protease HslVU (ClpYQ) peptidase subunit